MLSTSLFSHFSSTYAFAVWIVGLGLRGLQEMFKNDLKDWMNNRRVTGRFYSSIVLLGFVLLTENFFLRLFGVGIIAGAVFTLFFPLPHEYALVLFNDQPKALQNTLSKYGKLLSVPVRLSIATKVLKLTNGIERDTFNLDLLNDIKSMHLLKKEQVEHQLPAMVRLFKDGDIKTLDKELSEVPNCNDVALFHHLECCSCYKKCDFDGMQEALDEDNKVHKLSEEQRLTDDINFVSAALESGNNALYNYHINKLDDYFFNEHLERVESLGDLLYFYAQNKNWAKADKIIAYIRNKKYKDFEELTAYYDLIYSYYKEIGNRNGCISLIVELNSKSHAMQRTTEDKMVYDLQILRLCFEQDYDWERYSIEILKNMERYCSFSYRVFMQFATTMKILLHSAMTVNQRTLSDKASLDLCTCITTHEEKKWKNERTKLLATIPNSLLYYRCNLWMDEWTISYFVSEKENNNIEKYLIERIVIVGKVIDECEACGNTREQLHFITVLIDEIISTLEQAEQFPLDENLKVIRQKKDYYLSEADKYIRQMTDICESYSYNRFLAYYLLFLSRFFLYKGDKKKSSYYVNKFDNYHVSITSFTLVIQKMYNDINIQLGRVTA